MAVASTAAPAGPGDDPSGRSRQDVRRRRLERRHRWQPSVLALLVALLAAGTGTAAWTVIHYGGNLRTIEAAVPTAGRPPAAEPAGEGADPPVTVVLVGLDPGAGRDADVTAEAVSLVRLTGDRRHAQLVSFPLETWTAAPGERGTTLQAAYGRGDRAALVEALETLTGVRVDHHVEIDFTGFRSMVDALGGVDVDVPEPYRNRGYTFEPGVQRLDGEAALAYVRDADGAARSGSAGRQQAVVAALFRAVSAQGIGDVGALTGLLESLTSSLAVDDTLGPTDLLQLAWSLRRVAEPEFLSVPISGSGTEAGTPVVYVDAVRSAALWGYLASDTLAGHADEFR